MKRYSLFSVLLAVAAVTLVSACSDGGGSSSDPSADPTADPTAEPTPEPEPTPIPDPVTLGIQTGLPSSIPAGERFDATLTLANSTGGLVDGLNATLTWDPADAATIWKNRPATISGIAVSDGGESSLKWELVGGTPGDATFTLVVVDAWDRVIVDVSRTMTVAP